MKNLESFITSIKQFITGTANNLKTILDKKFKGSGLIEVTTETIRDTGDIEVKLKDIPGKSLIGNDATGNARPKAITMGVSMLINNNGELNLDPWFMDEYYATKEWVDQRNYIVSGERANLDFGSTIGRDGLGKVILFEDDGAFEIEKRYSGINSGVSVNFPQNSTPNTYINVNFPNRSGTVAYLDDVGGASNVIQVSFLHSSVSSTRITLPFGHEATINNNTGLYEIDNSNSIKVKSDGLYRIELAANRNRNGAPTLFAVWTTVSPLIPEQVILNPQSMHGDTINVSDVRLYELTTGSLVYVTAVRSSGAGTASVSGRLLITKIG